MRKQLKALSVQLVLMDYISVWSLAQHATILLVTHLKIDLKTWLQLLSYTVYWGLWIESTRVYVGVSRRRWGQSQALPRHFNGDIREASACVVCWRTVQCRGTAVYKSTECIAARNILHDVTHELVSRKNTEKCPQRRLSMPT